MISLGSYPVYYYRNQFNIKKMDRDLAQQKEILKEQMSRVAESDTLSEAEKSKRLEKFNSLLKTLDEKLETGTVKNPYVKERPVIEKEDIPLAIGLKGDRGIKKGKPLANILRGIRDDFYNQVSELEVHQSENVKEDSLQQLLKKVEQDTSFLKSESVFNKNPEILRPEIFQRVLSFGEEEKPNKNAKDSKEKKSTNRLMAKLSTYRYFDVRNVARILPNVKNPKVKYRALDLIL